MVNMSVWKLVLDHLAVGYIHMIRKPVDGYSNLIVNSGKSLYCTARQCSPLRRKFMECYIIKPAQLLLMKHLVIGQR